jgi:CopG antitoxin of type II toxin-antitoxin system
MVMRRVTVSLPEDLYEKLRIRAEERCLTMSALARQAIGAKVGLYNLDTGPSQRVAAGPSGFTGTARLASEFDVIVREGLKVVERKMRQRDERRGVAASIEEGKRRDSGALRH